MATEIQIRPSAVSSDSAILGTIQVGRYSKTTVDRPAGTSTPRRVRLTGWAATTRELLDPESRRSGGDKGRRAPMHRFGLTQYVAAYESAVFPS